ncbi:DUF1631 domain-containing protein [Luteimonas yindakuii]|uniref:DUF1631 domain-containing protein n=1 Tax=Luteimonas yindakuii TaxID=2565782 RepID=A0A4Z1RD51_9GAMM|nr:hypothetical protein [Luteimonas yindakuii]TKS54083.1 DUF1631 domain-containing protein [Luteimonas yindakuii]
MPSPVLFNHALAPVPAPLPTDRSMRMASVRPFHHRTSDVSHDRPIGASSHADLHGRQRGRDQALHAAQPIPSTVSVRQRADATAAGSLPGPPPPVRRIQSNARLVSALTGLARGDRARAGASGHGLSALLVALASQAPPA